MTSDTSQAGGGGTNARPESHNSSRLQASEYTTCSNIADTRLHSSRSTAYKPFRARIKGQRLIILTGSDATMRESKRTKYIRPRNFAGRISLAKKKLSPSKICPQNSFPQNCGKVAKKIR
jgi:hypothetical protein